MIFWIVCAVLTLAVTALVVTPLLRPKMIGDDNPDIAIYRAQLEEIDRDLERGSCWNPQRPIAPAPRSRAACWLQTTPR